jgi:hypothetical protein
MDMELNELDILGPKLKGKIDRIVQQWITDNLSDERLAEAVNRLLDQSLDKAIMLWLGFEQNWDKTWRLRDGHLSAVLTQRQDKLMAEVVKHLDFEPMTMLSKAEIASLRTTYRRELLDTARHMADRKGNDDAQGLINRIIAETLEEGVDERVFAALDEYEEDKDV